MPVRAGAGTARRCRAVRMAARPRAPNSMTSRTRPPRHPAGLASTMIRGRRVQRLRRGAIRGSCCRVRRQASGMTAHRLLGDHLSVRVDEKRAVIASVRRAQPCLRQSSAPRIIKRCRLGALSRGFHRGPATGGRPYRSISDATHAPASSMRLLHQPSNERCARRSDAARSRAQTEQQRRSPAAAAASAARNVASARLGERTGLWRDMPTSPRRRVPEIGRFRLHRTHLSPCRMPIRS